MVDLPKWLQNMPDGHAKNRALDRFYLRMASLYASESGHLYDLAILIGIKYDTLKSQQRHIPCSQTTKDAIRRLLGPAFVPPDTRN